MLATIIANFVTLLAIINPIEAAAAFAALTANETPQRRAMIARRACIVAAVITISFGFVGEALLNAMSIGFPAFRIAGGLLLLKVGYNMVFAKEQGTRKLDAAEQEAAEASDDISVFPLAMPLITGPGTLTTVVALMSKRGEPLYGDAVVIACVIVVIGLTYLAMRSSEVVTRFLGPTGVNAVGRVMGIIVAGLAVQLIVDGVEESFPMLSR